MIQRQLSPIWFAFLEGSVAVCWVILFSGLMADKKEMLVLLGFPILLGVCWRVMQWVYRLSGTRGAAAAGTVLIIAGTLWFSNHAGVTSFLIGVCLIGLVFVGRFISILSERKAAEDLFRTYFLIESVLFPLYSVLCFGYGLKSELVPPVVLISATVVFFFLRCFVLVLVQRMNRGTWHFHLRSTLFPVALVMAGLLLLAAFPYVLYALAWLVVPIVQLLQPLIVKLHDRQSKHGPEDQPASSASPSNASNEIDPAVYSMPHWVWILALMLVVGAVLVVFQTKNAERVQPLNQAKVQIVRTKWSGKRGLSYVVTDSPVRLIYQQMLRWLERKGKPIGASETSREYTSRLSEQEGFQGTVHRDMQDLAIQYEKSRYGIDTQPEKDEAGADKAREIWNRVKSRSENDRR